MIYNIFILDEITALKPPQANNMLERKRGFIAHIYKLAVTLLTTVQTLNRQTNERTTSQRFGKIKRGATPPTSQRTVAPHLLLPQPHKDDY